VSIRRSFVRSASSGNHFLGVTNPLGMGGSVSKREGDGETRHGPNLSGGPASPPFGSPLTSPRPAAPTMAVEPPSTMPQTPGYVILTPLRPCSHQLHRHYLLQCRPGDLIATFESHPLVPTVFRWEHGGNRVFITGMCTCAMHCDHI
jgi:hypothetical protein